MDTTEVDTQLPKTINCKKRLDLIRVGLEKQHRSKCFFNIWKNEVNARRKGKKEIAKEFKCVDV